MVAQPQIVPDVELLARKFAEEKLAAERKLAEEKQLAEEKKLAEEQEEEWAANARRFEEESRQLAEQHEKEMENQKRINEANERRRFMAPFECIQAMDLGSAAGYWMDLTFNVYELGVDQPYKEKKPKRKFVTYTKIVQEKVYGPTDDLEEGEWEWRDVKRTFKRYI